MTVLLLAHIISMSTSMVFVLSIAVAGMLSLQVHRNIMRLSLFLTSIGIGTGFMLLINNPFNARCAALIAYTFVFVLIYVFTSRRNQSLVRSES